MEEQRTNWRAPHPAFSMATCWRAPLGSPGSSGARRGSQSVHLGPWAAQRGSWPAKPHLERDILQLLRPRPTALDTPGPPEGRASQRPACRASPQLCGRPCRAMVALGPLRAAQATRPCPPAAGVTAPPAAQAGPGSATTGYPMRRSPSSSALSGICTWTFPPSGMLTATTSPTSQDSALRHSPAPPACTQRGLPS